MLIRGKNNANTIYSWYDENYRNHTANTGYRTRGSRNAKIGELDKKIKIIFIVINFIVNFKQ